MHPAVQITSVLREMLEDDGFVVDEYLQYFSDWKSGWPANEFKDPFFGKDGEYARPTRSGKRVLRHVHLPPEALDEKVAEWEARAARDSRKTSNTSLVYAQADTHGFLLIAILKEPIGHEVAEMKTKETSALMENFADIAVHFQMTGNVLV